MAAKEHEHPKPQEGNRPPIEAARVPVPGAARVRGPEERTPGEDVLGEDTRASDELMGEARSTPDQLIVRARAAEGVVVSDELAAAERERMRAMGVAREAEDVEPERTAAELEAAAFAAEELEEAEGGEELEEGEEPASPGLRAATERATAPGLGRVPVREGAERPSDVPAGREGAAVVGRGRPAAEDEVLDLEDTEMVERHEAWEHAPDLERTSQQLESGAGEREALSVIRPMDQARFDSEANAAYDEEVRGAEPRLDRQERTAATPAPGPATTTGREEHEPPPQSVLDVERAEPSAHAAAAPAKRRARRTKAAPEKKPAEKKPRKAAAEGGTTRARRTSRRTTEEKKKQQPRSKESEADASP